MATYYVVQTSSTNHFDNTTTGTWGYLPTDGWDSRHTTTCSTYDATNYACYNGQAWDMRAYEPPAEECVPVVQETVHKTAPSKKAEELLLSILTDEEKETYRLNNCVVMEALGKKYKLIRRRANNILELDDNGIPVARLCAHVSPDLPDEDNLAAQVLALRVAPELIMSVANRTNLNM